MAGESVGTRPRYSGVQLLTDSQPADHFKILFPIVEPQIFQQARPLRDHHQQPAAAGVVLGVRLEVIRQIIDPGRQQGDLHFGRTRIHFAPAECADDLRLLLLRDRHLTPQYHRPFSKPSLIDPLTL